jgi:general secretion pathway protein B
VSFILDALRKSEARRKAGEVPSIDSETSHGASRRPRRRRFGLVVVLVPLCAVLLAAGIYLAGPEWLSQRSAQVDSPDPAPEVAVLPEIGEEERTAEGLDERALTQVEPIEDVAESADDDEEIRTEDEPAPPVDRRRAVQPATGQAITREAPERERVVTDHDEAMAEIERRVAETRRRVDEAAETPRERRTREAPVADRERATERPAVADIPAEEGDAVEDWRPQAAEYVRAWELPLSVRRSMPDLKLSIHVFTPEEDRRFVLINGERYVPGDQLSGGARLVDIRREGAIVDYREHRFLLEP